MIKDLLINNHSYIVLYIISVSISIYLIPYIFLILQNEIIESIGIYLIALPVFLAFVPVLNIATILIGILACIIKFFTIIIDDAYKKIEPEIITIPLGELK